MAISGHSHFNRIFIVPGSNGGYWEAVAGFAGKIANPLCRVKSDAANPANIIPDPRRPLQRARADAQPCQSASIQAGRT